MYIFSRSTYQADLLSVKFILAFLQLDNCMASKFTKYINRHVSGRNADVCCMRFFQNFLSKLSHHKKTELFGFSSPAIAKLLIFIHNFWFLKCLFWRNSGTVIMFFKRKKHHDLCNVQRIQPVHSTANNWYVSRWRCYLPIAWNDEKIRAFLTCLP